MYLAHNTQMLGEDEASYFSLAKEFMEFNYSSDTHVVFPFVSLFYTPFFYILGSSLSLAKMIITFFGFLTLIMVYLFCKKVDATSFFGINVFGLIAVSILLTISYFTHFMLISYAEIPIAFFSIMLLYLLLDFSSIKKAILIGNVMGLSLYVKSSAFLFPIVLLFFFLLKYILRKDKNSFKLALISCLIAALIILPFALRNIILFNYPYIEGMNFFFKVPEQLIPKWATTEITKSVSISIDVYGLFGYVALFLSIFGVVYFLETKNENMIFVTITFLLFLLMFFVRNLLGAGISDPRYFSVIFPQVAIIGGYYINNLSKLKKYLLLILIIFFVYSLTTSVSVALSTSQSQRYPTDYIDALKWIKQNTNKNDLIFTAYGGSLAYYGERKNFWSTFEEFPDVMTSTNSTYIYETLKKYNLSYILIWRGILSNNWIIPGSNIAGVFTYNFVTQVGNDNQHFNLTYSNMNSQGQSDNFIFKVL